jgi:hypothetical protein
MPAIYATAYQGGNGKRYVVLTNKGSNAVPVQITGDGLMLTNQFLETYVTGSDPSAVNSNPPLATNIVILSTMATNPVAIPEYSVVRLEWTVFNVPSPVAGVNEFGPAPTMQWTGLTNVIYDVQAATHLPGSWTTLGRVGSTLTNFNFTNWNSGPQQFYRLAVP